jgi:uncharacterized membrane protein (UPF0127 family)
VSALVSIRARNLTRSTLLADDVEVASSFWGRFMGLMGRTGLPHGHALWLPDDNGIHMFFMRFAIDAVFLGKPSTELGGAELGGAGLGGAERGGPAVGGRGPGGAELGGAELGGPQVGGRPIVALRPALAPWVGLVPLVRGAHGVLELPAGTIAASGSQVGDRISIA